jgi:muramoyltetrapeptide carboxypeptidase
MPEEEKGRPYLSGPDSLRLESVQRGMESPESSGLLAVRGGYGATRLLTSLSGLWKNFPPKPLIGFSDVTALHLARMKACGCGGWHSPNLTTLGRLGVRKTREVLSALKGERREPWIFPPSSVFNSGKARGPLLGGNLTLFSQLYGSGYCPDAQGHILLLEDVDEKAYSIDRMLTLLSLKGAFLGIQALVFGSFEKSDDPALVAEMLSDFAGTLAVPVMLNAPFGHGSDNLPWYYGETAEFERGSLGFAVK